MATVITEETGSKLYLSALRHIIKNHRLRSPRDLTTLDAGFVVLELRDPTDGLPWQTTRRFNPNIAAAEAVQLVGGFSQPSLLTRASAKFETYMDGDHFHGAYGARVMHQVACAVTKLREDPATRQAVITLWDPWLDNQPGKRDYPCTVSLQFQVEPYAGALEMNVVMRSNDAWLGLPYDVFQFTQLQLSVAHALDRVPGWYRHTALSLHIYETDLARAQQVESQGIQGTAFTARAGWTALGFGRPGDSFTDIMKRARRTTTELVNVEETDSERWYRERFASYMGRDVDDGGESDREEVTLQP